MLNKNRLMTAMVLILSAGFLATTLIGYFVSRASLRSEITSSSLPLTSDNIYSEIQRDLLQPIFISSLMAHDTFVRDWVLKGERDSGEIVKYLAAIREKYGTLTTFFVSDLTGNYYNADGILKKVAPGEARDVWYYRVRGLGADYEINIDPDMGNRDTMTVFINHKVYDYRNRFIGATGVGLAVSSVKKTIDYYQEKYERNIFFVDKEGRIALRGGASPGTDDSILSMEGIKRYAREILSSTGSTFSFMRGGRHNYLNTRYIEEFGWYLLVEQDEDTASRVLVRTLFLNIMISLAITSFVLLSLRAQIRSYQGRIETLATTDKLTGLYNRQAFDGIMEQAFRERKRSKVDMALIMLDLDFFKKVNDTYGHLCGDEVLKQASARMKTALRESDALCRWGGEEFFILMKGCSQDDARKMAEKIRLVFEGKEFMVQGHSILLTVSQGITLFREDDTLESAVARSDRAMYAAKSAGRNAVESN